MRIDLHCPVEHLSTEFARDDRGNVRAYLRFNNLSGHTVERLDAVAIFEDGSGKQVQTPFSMEDLDVKPRSAFPAMVSTDELPSATRLSVQFSRVIFGGEQPVWMYSAARLVDVPELPKPDGRELNRLTAAAGDDAVVFPLQTGNLWVCVCARANPYRRKKCRRCGRERDHVLIAYDMARLLSRPAPNGKPAKIDMPLLDKASTSAQEDDKIMRRRFKRERGMLIRRTITMLLIAALLLLCAWFFGRQAKEPNAVAPTKVDEPSTLSPSRA